MKKILFLTNLFALLQTIVFAQAPSPTSPGTLFLKFNNPNANNEFLIFDNNTLTSSWKNGYMFTSKDSKSRSINMDFYIPDETKFWYVNPATYAAVAKDNNQLRDILDFPMRHPDRTNYIKGFSKIYVLDLEQPNPSNPSMYKLIEVKPYFPWEH